MSAFKRLLLFICLLFIALPASAGEIRLAVAASMTDVVNALCADYAHSHPDTHFVRNYASSGTLAKQIAAGAPADLFISANPKWMTFLKDKGLVEPASIHTIAHNSLVVIGRADSTVQVLADLATLPRIAMGSPGSVPAGKYAEQALIAAGLYPQMKDGQKLVLTKDVRQALMYAERGEVDAAFVYRTDAMLAKNAVLLLEVPQDLYPRISYPAGLTTTGTASDEVHVFVNYLRSPNATAIFTAQGFSVQ